MQKVNNNNTIQESLKKSTSIGALLINARNAAALSQADIAEQLNLSIRIIKALEADEDDNLPEPIYIRGYLSNYARVVGINDVDLIKLYADQHCREPVVVEVNRKTIKSYDPAILWSTAAVLSVLVGLVITWWFETNQIPKQGTELANNAVVVNNENVKKSQSDTSLTNNDQELIVSEDSKIITQATQEPSLNSSLGEDEQSTSNVIEVITADQHQAMEEASQNPTLVSSMDGAQVLTVTYVEKSWTEIRDADSNTLMQGLIEPGVVRNLSGKPPFEIFLGNAPGVVIEVNGLYFDHSQYNRSNRTARFQVSSGSLN